MIIDSDERTPMAYVAIIPLLEWPATATGKIPNLLRSWTRAIWGAVQRG
jgi:hypothetical protein